MKVGMNLSILAVFVMLGRSIGLAGQDGENARLRVVIQGLDNQIRGLRARVAELATENQTLKAKLASSERGRLKAEEAEKRIRNLLESHRQQCGLGDFPVTAEQALAFVGRQFVAQMTESEAMPGSGGAGNIGVLCLPPSAGPTDRVSIDSKGQFYQVRCIAIFGPERTEAVEPGKARLISGTISGVEILPMIKLDQHRTGTLFRVTVTTAKPGNPPLAPNPQSKGAAAKLPAH